MIPNINSSLISTQLSVLKIANNKFTGNIPKNIENMEVLYSLQLNNNQLEGTLLESIRKLSYKILMMILVHHHYHIIT